MTEDKGILIRNIYYMLTYAFQELRKNNYDSIAGEEFENINDLFAEILTCGISYLLKQGLHKEYVPNTETLTTLRGKLNVEGTIQQRLVRNQRLVCDYDDFSENYIFNQILKSTCLVLINNPDVKSYRRQSLRKLMLFFSNVNPINLESINWTALRFDRNTRTYQMLLYMCYFIVKNMLLTTDRGKYDMDVFSDENMNRLYEKFILEYYKRHHPDLRAEAGQIDWNIKKDVSDANVLPIMKTDVMLHLSKRTLIIDAKYYGKTMQRHFDKRTIHSNNLYQIQSYVYNYDKEHTGEVDGMLLYAKTQEDIVPDNKIVLNDGNVIYFRTLDLNQTFDGIKKQLDILVNKNKKV